MCIGRAGFAILGCVALLRMFDWGGAFVMRWVIVIGIGVGILLIFATGRIPGTNIQSSLSDDTRTAAALRHTPKYTNQQAVDMVVADIRQNCAEWADFYLGDLDQRTFAATWMHHPRSDDYYERRLDEWTVTHETTRHFWRMYEDNDEILGVIGHCKSIGDR